LLDVVRTRTPDQLGLAETLRTRAAVAERAGRELGVARSVWVRARFLRRQRRRAGTCRQGFLTAAAAQEPTDLAADNGFVQGGPGQPGPLTRE
jgi:hypothetical protein